MNAIDQVGEMDFVLGVPSDLYGFQASVNSPISLGVSSAPLSQSCEEAGRGYERNQVLRHSLNFLS